MSDYDGDTDYIDAPESFDDFDGDDGEKVDALNDTQDANDAVADILMGKESPQDATREGRDHTTRDVDSHGKIADYQSTGQDQQRQQAPEYGLQGHNIQQQMSAAEQQYAQAFQAKERLENMFRNGEINRAEFEQGMNMAGQYAGAAKGHYMQSQLQAYEYEKQAERAYSQLANEFPEFGPATRNEALKETAQWLQQNGLSDDLLRQVDDPNIIAVARRAMNAIQNEQTNRLENAKLKQAVRELKKRLGVGRAAGGRDSQAGGRGNSRGKAHQIDEVSRILMGGK